jgi:lysophospholipase L1-like esterase
VEDLPNLLAESPHLIIVAYGMNDVGRRDPKWYGERTRTIIEGIRSKLPESEIVLVSPMLGHAEWVHTPREMFPLYRDELTALTGHGIALADVTAVWQHLLTRKHDLDLTGNGLNHPNDFGHRLYAQAIVRLFKAADR